MTTATQAPVPFAFRDVARRTFVALNRAGDSYHYCHPAEADDERVTGRRMDDGSLSEPLVDAGALVCECKGGRYRGRCYVVEAAEALLEAAPDWSEAPGWNGAGASVEAARG